MLKVLPITVTYQPEKYTNLQTRFELLLLKGATSQGYRGFTGLASVVQRVDNAIHRINHYPVDSVVCFANTYPLDSDLSAG